MYSRRRVKPPSRWDRVLDQKPKPLAEHLLDEVAKIFAQDLQQWPLPVEYEQSPARRWDEIPRPDDRLYAQAFHLAELDLQREHDAYDDYFRNQRFLEAGLSPQDKPALLFVSTFVTEQALALQEATHTKLTRADLVSLLQRTRRHFFHLESKVTA